MIGSPSGELLKKPQQSGQGQALTPKEKKSLNVCVCVDECTNRDQGGGAVTTLLYMFSSPGSLTT